MTYSREDSMRWSVVVPAYNEEQRLPAYLREIITYFDDREIFTAEGKRDGLDCSVEFAMVCPAGGT